ncbi:phage tail protein [Achromobacter sp. MY14]|uniref:phage tail protein n=1 Tax=unclassified Achromobacter TaxID=2626865 RepID=UPI001E539626|nr:phage tail protein [Achromobacter sp. MY14]MCD0498546.1 phage tail protein [Achromobacter sp. MY14]
MKVVHQTDPNGFFLHEVGASELALSPGDFNIPFGAYVDAPPTVPAGKVARREGDRWVVVDDHRSTPLWNVETAQPYSVGTSATVDGKEVLYPGYGPIPAWLTVLEPVALPAGPENPDLAEQRRA